MDSAMLDDNKKKGSLKRSLSRTIQSAIHKIWKINKWYPLRSSTNVVCLLLQKSFLYTERERRKKCVHEFDYRMMHLHLDRKHCRQSLMHDVAHWFFALTIYIHTHTLKDNVYSTLVMCAHGIKPFWIGYKMNVYHTHEMIALRCD